MNLLCCIPQGAEPRQHKTHTHTHNFDLVFVTRMSNHPSSHEYEHVETNSRGERRPLLPHPSIQSDWDEARSLTPATKLLPEQQKGIFC